MYIESHRQELYAPLDIVGVLARHIIAPSQTELYWKLSLVHPQPSSLTPPDTTALSWLYSKLGNGQNNSLTTSTQPLSIISQSLGAGRCVNVAMVALASGFSERVAGTSAILLHVPLPTRGDTIEVWPGCCCLLF